MSELRTCYHGGSESFRSQLQTVLAHFPAVTGWEMGYNLDGPRPVTLTLVVKPGYGQADHDEVKMAMKRHIKLGHGQSWGKIYYIHRSI